MGLFTISPNFNSMESLLIDQLQDLFDAENQLVKALPDVADAATDHDLKRAIETHLQETRQQAARLERVFRIIGQEPQAKTCQAMKGLLKEGDEVINAEGDPDVKDAAIIAACQRVEHYEMAGYGSARAFAQRLGHREAAQLLQQTLDEESAADEKLTEIAEGHINAQATAHG